MEGFQTKICTGCGIEWHLACFSFNFSSRDGKYYYSSYCLHCIDNRNRRRKEITEPNDDSLTKFCSGCGETKSINEFYYYKLTGTHHRLCKICRRQYNSDLKLQQRYGVTKAWREETLAAQDNKCGICKVEFNTSNLKACIDHDASSGKARGILCNPCNVLLGMHQENPNSLRAAGFDRHAEYLECFKKVHEIKLVG